jgi:hypothetical protein
MPRATEIFYTVLDFIKCLFLLLLCKWILRQSSHSHKHILLQHFKTAVVLIHDWKHLCNLFIHKAKSIQIMQENIFTLMPLGMVLLTSWTQTTWQRWMNPLLRWEHPLPVVERQRWWWVAARTNSLSSLQTMVRTC